MNEIITIEKQIIKKNGFGELESIVWKPKLSNIRSQVTYNSGGRVDENNELFFAYSVIFTVRIYHPIHELDRVVWNGKNYRILAIQTDKAIQRQLLHCELINE